ncbi:NDP-sugar synthase [Janibacter terrae]|uniref:NDP-sugar synthase n=1 Tax=Janibacter terrae TaxID=103817 RepID=UPI0031F747EC
MAGSPAAADLPRGGPVVARLDAVVLAGGLGRRMDPLTRDLPKPLLPVGLHPLVEHQVACLSAVGVDRVVLATSYRADDFTDLTRALRAKGVHLTTVVEETARGTGGGLRGALRALPGADEVVVLNGDLLTGHDLAAQIASLRTAPSEVLGSVHVREVPDARRYGSVLTEGRRVRAFVEKSPDPPSRIVNAGTYVVRAALLEVLAAGVLSLEHEVFPALAARDALHAYREEAYFLDVGTPAALVRANRDLVLGDGPSWLLRDGSDTHGALVAADADVDPSSTVAGGSVVHPRASIGPGASLEAAVVLPGATVAAGAVVIRSVIGRDARVGPGAQVVDAALGTGGSAD